MRAMLDYDFIRNVEPLGTPMDAARCLNGLEFWHGERQITDVFEFRKIEQAVREASSGWSSCNCVT